MKKTRSQNSLALEDVQRIWIPFLVFDNTENNEATKVINQSKHIKILDQLKTSQTLAKLLAGFLTLGMASTSGVNTVQIKYLVSLEPTHVSRQVTQSVTHPQFSLW